MKPRSLDVTNETKGRGSGRRERAQRWSCSPTGPSPQEAGGGQAPDRGGRMQRGGARGGEGGWSAATRTGLPVSFLHPGCLSLSPPRAASEALEPKMSHLLLLPRFALLKRNKAAAWNSEPINNPKGSWSGCESNSDGKAEG